VLSIRSSASRNVYGCFATTCVWSCDTPPSGSLLSLPFEPKAKFGDARCVARSVAASPFPFDEGFAWRQ